MPPLNQESWSALQPALNSGESVVWSGQPNARIVFHKEDVFLIPFSLLWGGFAIFWEAGVLGAFWTGSHSHAPFFFALWGIPFVVIGQYLIWGRFCYAAWLKKRTYYAVTNRRVITVQNSWKPHMASAYIDALPTLIKEGSSEGAGTLRFSQGRAVRNGFSQSGWGPWNSVSVGDSPAFIDIDNIDSVYQLVSDLREKSKSGKTAL